MKGAAEARPAKAVPNGIVGMWLFLSSEIMFFAALIGGYIVLRLGAGPGGWPNPEAVLDTPLLAFNTFVLISSSFTMALALAAAKEGDGPRARRFLLLTAALGCVFLGIKAYDYHHLWHAGTTIRSGLFGNYYYTLTGFHGLHVAAGVAALAALVPRADGTEGAAVEVEAAGLYWHFVDIVWIVLFVILCLV